MPQPSLAVRSMIACATLLVLCSGTAAAQPATTEPVAIRLLSQAVPLTQDDPDFHVTVRDNRPDDEGGDDPGLLGWIREDGNLWRPIRADGADPAFAMPSLVLATLRGAGYDASASSTPDALVLELRLERFWIGGTGERTAAIEAELVMRPPGGGRGLRAQRMSAQGRSSRPSPEGPREAIARATNDLRSQLRGLFESSAFQASYMTSLTGETSDSGEWSDGGDDEYDDLDDGYDEHPYEHARERGYVMRRVVGVGAGARIGMEHAPDWGATEIQGEFLSFELRLVPASFFSFDWVVDFVGPIIVGAVQQDLPEFRTTFLGHFNFADDGRAAAAFAPGLHLRVIPWSFGEADAYAYLAFRLGADIRAPGREFGVGLYIRPMIGGYLGGDIGEDPRIELYAEVTWTLFAGRWERRSQR